MRFVTLHRATSSYWLKSQFDGGRHGEVADETGIAAFERQWNYDASYVHEMIEADPRAAWMFSRAAAIGKYRKDVPARRHGRPRQSQPCDTRTAARARSSACRWPSGRASMPKVLRAVLTEDPTAMPADVALAWRFTRATLDHDPSADQYRDEIIRRWGPRAVVSLAFAMV